MFLKEDNGIRDTGLLSIKSSIAEHKALPTSSNISIVNAGDYTFKYIFDDWSVTGISASMLPELLISLGAKKFILQPLW